MEVDHSRFMARLKELQGDLKDAAFARRAGIPPSTIKQWEKGSFPSIAIASKIAAAFDVTVDWLSGIDDRPIGDGKAEVLNSELFNELGKIVVREHKAAGLVLLPEMVAPEAGQLYNELVARVRDISDQRSVKAMLPVLAESLRNRLREAAAAPGSGKREAS